MMDSLSHRRRVLSSTLIVLVTIAPLLVELPDTSPTLRSMGASLGWLGAGLLSGSLLLIVREPWVARWFGGLERMYRWHHVLGVWACGVLIAHPVVLAATALSTSAARAWSLLSPARWFPANVFGWAALLGLIAGVSATLFWRLPYRAWRGLHIVLSVAVLLGIAHAFSYTGLTASLVLVAAPSILAVGWRLLRTDRALGAHAYEVESVSSIAPGTSEIVLRPLSNALKSAPGQFVMVAFFDGPHYHGCGEFHPYTVCDVRPDGALVLAIQARGDCTTRIQSVRKGVAARLQGPYDKVAKPIVSSPLTS